MILITKSVHLINLYFWTDVHVRGLTLLLCLLCSIDKPLAPQNVIVNITKDGYYITWTHTAVPGRPEVEKFVVEYREGNGSSTWHVAAADVQKGRRVYLFKAEMIEEDKTYDFRVFAFGANEFSDAAYVSKTYKLGEFVLLLTNSCDFAFSQEFLDLS